ncbi:hypothetical protein [Clostridium butyricum]|uniref:hypothetical protein n=1 Tax=Clostridium butyricum TaxID=1492 RepID=UPI00071064FB|nr:hypothetical protein [Clostridium butyricum]
MTITKKIESSLSSINLPASFLKREDGVTECIVYNYTESPSNYGDLKEISSKYTVLINLYCTKNLEKNKKIVKEAMIKGGFKKVVIPTTTIENGVYNTAMKFKIALIN